MTLEHTTLLKNMLLFLLPLLFVFLVMQVDWEEKISAVNDAGSDFAGRILKKSKIDYFRYDSIQRFLNSKGAVYLFGNLATPVNYMILKILIVLLMFMTGMSLGGVLPAFLVGFMGFFVPDLLLTISNNADNDEMLTDIKCIYDTLRIQTKAGVYLSASLSECYLACSNRRLKSALLELTNDINTRRDMEDALERFHDKFDCGQIDLFCIVIRQSLESGKSVKILEDLSLQMNDLQHAINLKAKEALERKVQIIELLIFIGLLAVTVYSLGMEVMTSVLSF